MPLPCACPSGSREKEPNAWFASNYCVDSGSNPECGLERGRFSASCHPIRQTRHVWKAMYHARIGTASMEGEDDTTFQPSFIAAPAPGGTTGTLATLLTPSPWYDAPVPVDSEG